ncbi:MAG: hypothetical protein WC269_06490 [Candidatus Gracilibacteria bacterium]|jgi:hypothetical protein
MKKFIEVTILDQIPDWNTTELPKGVYYNNQNLHFYNGDKLYPNQFYIQDPLSVFAEKTTEPQAIQTTLSVKEVIDLVTAIRRDPNNF